VSARKIGEVQKKKIHKSASLRVKEEKIPIYVFSPTGENSLLMRVAVSKTTLEVWFLGPVQREHIYRSWFPLVAPHFQKFTLETLIRLLEER